MGRHLLIAETDDGGAVVCVRWLPEGAQHACPAERGVHAGVIDLAATEFCGAAPDAIRHWLDRRRP